MCLYLFISPVCGTVRETNNLCSGGCESVAGTSKYISNEGATADTRCVSRAANTHIPHARALDNRQRVRACERLRYSLYCSITSAGCSLSKGDISSD